MTSSVPAWLLACVLMATPPIPERIREGLALLEAGAVDRAEAVFREVVRESPRHGTARLQLGRIALERGDWEAARRHLVIAVESDPRRPYLAWQLLGQAQLFLDEPAAARRSFDEALERAPRFGPALVGRARASLVLEDFDGALESCREAIDLGVRDRRAYLILGDLHLRKMETSEALAAYSEALRLDPAAVEVIPSFALSALATAGAPAAAQPGLAALLESHLEAHPGCEQALYGLGLASLHAGDLAASERTFRELTRVAPRRSDAWYNLGLVLSRLGHEGDGRAAMERFRELRAGEDEEP